MPPRRLIRRSALAVAYLGASYAGFALGGPWNILLGLANGLAVGALIVGGRGAPRLVAATILPAGALAGLAGAESAWLGLGLAAGPLAGCLLLMTPAAGAGQRPTRARRRSGWSRPARSGSS